MLNSHQILPGARTRGTIKTYVDADYITDIEFTGTGAFTINGEIEFDGIPFELEDLDISSIATGAGAFLPEGEYVVGAVPKYNEPKDRAEANANGFNYYVTDTALGETTVHYFLPADLESEVLQAGGHLVLAKKRNMGTATSGQITLLNRYEDELEKISDPRYVGQLLEPVGVDYVLRKVYRQDNSSRKDALSEMTNQELELFKATQGYIAAQRKVMPIADAVSAYENADKQAKIKRAFVYASEEDAKNDVDGIEILLEDYRNRPDVFSNPVELDGSTTASGTHVAVFELYQPTYMSRGHYGTQPGTEKLYTRDEAPGILGRVNPIYLANDLQVARASFNRARPLGALTRYAHALVVGRFNLGSGAISDSGVYTPGTIKPAGAPAGGTTPGFNSGVGAGNIAL